MEPSSEGNQKSASDLKSVWIKNGGGVLTFCSYDLGYRQQQVYSIYQPRITARSIFSRDDPRSWLHLGAAAIANWLVRTFKLWACVTIHSHDSVAREKP